MRIGLVFGAGALAVLAGCATPLQQCLYHAEQSTREIERELSERYANLSRGYSVEQILVPRLETFDCGNSTTGPRLCQRWEQDVEQIRHRIAPELERERVELLERQLARERPRAEAAAAQCRATYPE